MQFLPQATRDAYHAYGFTPFRTSQKHVHGPRERAIVGAVRCSHVCVSDRHVKPLHRAVVREHCDRS